MAYRRWLSSVLTMFVATLLLLAGAMYWISFTVRQPDYLVGTGDPSIAVEEKAFGMRNAHCDVLVYGDSSTMTGVDPSVVKADTGLTTCNIAVTWPVVSLFSTMPVDAYLEHNPRPKYLVLQFSPRTFYYRNDWDESVNLGPMAMLIRQKPGLATIWTLIKHGDRATQFFWSVILTDRQTNPERIAKFREAYDRRMQTFNDNTGPLTLDQPLQTRCTDPPKILLHPLDQGWLAALRSKYQRDGTTVLIKGSPVPDCDPQLAFFRRQIGPYVDENVEGLPIAVFNPGNQHVTLAGAQMESHQLAQLINSRRQRPR